MHTDKTLLVKGFQRLLASLPCMVMGPVVISQAFKNLTHQWFWPVLIVGILFAIAAIVLGFMGIKIVVDAFFGPKKKETS